MAQNAQHITKQRGYTIIETMIAISLFLVVVMFGMTSLLNANLVSRKTQDLRSILDNLSFIMDDISRNLRTGYDYRCYDISASGPVVTGVPQSCAKGWAIIFKPQTYSSADTNQMAYSVTGGKIYKSTDSGANFIPVTLDEVTIQTVSASYSPFSVLGAPSPGSSDYQQPFVIIRLVGTITYKGVDTKFSLQTSVSQRLIDI